MKTGKSVLIVAAVTALLGVGAYFSAFNFLSQPKFSLPAFNFAAESAKPVLENQIAKTPAKADNEISFFFAGDAMFGRNVGYKFQKNNFIDLFANFDKAILEEADIAWLNLEGPVSDKEVTQRPQDHSLVFNFSRETIEALKYLKITTAGLANNHTDNQGQKALAKTKEILEEARIDWNGEPNKISEDGIRRYQQGDLSVALISVNALYGAKGVEELIKEEKNKNNFVIVLPHWGNEYETSHNANQEKLARAFIAAGADLIIGGHPHVVQDAQVINGKLVFYSLGNFIFDQMFSAETQQGLILSGVIIAEKIKIKLVPIVSKKMKPEIMSGADKEKIIDRICSGIKDYCKDDIISI
ncbi:MAG: CapA family protein [Patescibacteria group bacterium]|nr:CapA family protein [Patescibacteria group bacterium]